MPIGGSNIAWDNTTPADTESAGLGDDRIRSMKTSVQQALDNEHNFPAGGGADTGYHRFGSARAYVGTQSAVSSSGSDGRLMYASDTSRLFGVGSEGTVFIGGQNVISAASRPVGGQRFYWAQEFGVAQVGAGSGAAIVNFSTTYNGVPFVTVSLISDGFAGGALSVWLDSLNGTGFTVKARASSTTGLITNASITSLLWISIGTRTF